MTVASERLHAAIVERRLRHRGGRELDRHVASAVAKQTGRGWRLDRATRDACVDAAVALAMAVERAQYRESPCGCWAAVEDAGPGPCYCACLKQGCQM